MATRRPPPPPPRAELTPDRMEQGIRRLERCIAEVEAFDPQMIQTYDDTSKADALSASVDGALVQTFGQGTVEYHRYSSATNFSWPLNMLHPTPVHEIQESLRRCRVSSLDLLRQAVAFLKQELEFAAGEVAAEQPSTAPAMPSGKAVVGNVFIGHGHSLVWRELKDLLEDRLGLSVDEFNRVPVAGIATSSRLSDMLDAAAFAFLVMTAEDEQTDGKVRARENVVHEVGLFQGRLGFARAIVLVEDGCEAFSNIHGLGQIRFPKGNIAAKFEDIRAVLEREGLIEP
jgi:predicted nucleotide-binding protein